MSFSNISDGANGAFDKFLKKMTKYIDSLDNLNNQAKATIISSLVPAALNAAVTFQNNVKNQELIETRELLEDEKVNLINAQKTTTEKQKRLVDKQEEAYEAKSLADLFKIVVENYTFLKSKSEVSDASGADAADVGKVYTRAKAVLPSA